MKNSLSKISNARSNFTNNFSSHSPRSLNSRPEHNAAKTPKKHTTVVCGDISSILVVLNLKSEKKRRNKISSSKCNPILSSSSSPHAKETWRHWSRVFTPAWKISIYCAVWKQRQIVYKETLKLDLHALKINLLAGGLFFEWNEIQRMVDWRSVTCYDKPIYACMYVKATELWLGNFNNQIKEFVICLHI